MVAMHFVQGIRKQNIRFTVAANSQSKADYTFKEVYQAVRAVARAKRAPDSDSDSDSSSSSSSDSSTGGGSARRHHDAKKAKEHKVTEVEVKMPNPAPTQFNMDDITKLIEEAARKLAGSYGMAPGPVQALGHPPQAPMIELCGIFSIQAAILEGRRHRFWNGLEQ
jgi:hypothetical protein